MDIEIADAILRTGLFEKIGEYEYRRVLEFEGTHVTANLLADGLSLSINPSVTNFAGHLNKRHAAAVMLEIAAKYAEKVNGTIVQHQNVVGCTVEGMTQRQLASYPEVHLDFSQLCKGWQETFVSPIGTEIIVEDDNA